jgi:tRNA pseudouridine65 synthase
MNSKVLEVIYHDPHLIAINKPHGLLVHASSIAAEATEHAVQQLRDQTGKWVFPVHRLDRKTAGVLLFAFDQETNSLMQQMFMGHQVEKVYHAIVRGYTPDEGTIDYPLTNDRGKVREAITRYRTLGRTELPVPVGKFATSRYSLVEVKPLHRTHAPDKKTLRTYFSSHHRRPASWLQQAKQTVPGEMGAQGNAVACSQPDF